MSNSLSNLKSPAILSKVSDQDDQYFLVKKPRKDVEGKYFSPSGDSCAGNNPAVQTEDSKFSGPPQVKTKEYPGPSPNNDEKAAVEAGLMPQQPVSLIASDEKKALVKLTIPRALKMGKGSKGSLSKPVMVRLVQNFFTTSAAAATNAAVYAVSATTSQDYANYAALYDEVCVRKIEVRAQVSCNTAVVGTSNWGFAVDHDNPTALASVADVMTFQSNSGPYSIGGSSVNVCPGYVTTKQFIPLSAKLHPGRATGDGTSANLVGGGWMSTSAATTVVACWVKFFCQGVGAGQSSLINCYVTSFCEFRQRQ